VTLAGAAAGVLLLTALSAALGPWAEAHYGLVIRLSAVSAGELRLLAAVLAVGVLASLVPGYRAYRLSLADGLTPHV